MADRSGFYINGDKICRVDVKIDWNLGFDKLAKEAYVAEQSMSGYGYCRSHISFT